MARLFGQRRGAKVTVRLYSGTLIRGISYRMSLCAGTFCLYVLPELNVHLSAGPQFLRYMELLSELTDDPRQDAASKLKYLMSSQPRRIAGCHLLLRGNRWMPVSVNKTLGANDRCSPSGAVISAFLLAVIEGDMIIGWMKNSAFSVQQPQPDGTLTPLDLTAAGLASQADSADMKANKAGIIGVSSLIAARRIEEQNTGHLPSRLREAAFERATVQILDKLQGHSVVGVRLYDC
jgi:hypothetical protein